MVMKSKLHAFLFLLPALAFIMTFLIVPIFRTFYFSFQRWFHFSPNYTFIGFQNYADLFNDRVMRIAMGNTVIMMIGVFIFQIVFALILAICVDSVKRGFKFFRTVYFFPIIISATAIGLMFSLIYNYNHGLLNYLLNIFGFESQLWLTRNRALYMMLIPVFWQFVGFYFIVFLTGITKIPEDIYESAMLDGITPIKKAVLITVPLLKDLLVANTILVIAGSLRVFDMVFMITGGGPMNASELMSSYMHRVAFMDLNTGYASAIAIVMLVFAVTLTTVLRFVASRFEEY